LHVTQARNDEVPALKKVERTTSQSSFIGKRNTFRPNSQAHMSDSLRLRGGSTFAHDDEGPGVELTNELFSSAESLYVSSLDAPPAQEMTPEELM
jgi:hypothetical protein